MDPEEEWKGRALRLVTPKTTEVVDLGDEGGDGGKDSRAVDHPAGKERDVTASDAPGSISGKPRTFVLPRFLSPTVK